MKKGYTNIESRGLPGGPNEMFTYVTGVFSTEGYKRNSPDVNNPHNLIPSGRITMKDVDFPVHGIDNFGNEQTMYPGKEYQFPGDYVFETPAFKNGGQHGGLDRWFAEKWVDVKTGKECGRQSGEQRDGYPACRPSKRISKDTPKTASELSSAEKARFKREKTSSERISYNHKKEYGGSVEEDFMYDMLTEMKLGGNVPTNPELWSRAKAAARSKYDVYPSAYANGFAAKWYKSKGGGWKKAEFGMETYDEYQIGGSTDKLQLLMDSYKNDFKPKTLEQKIAEKLQQEKGRTISRDNTAVRNNQRPDLTKKEYDKGNYIVKNRGDYAITKNNKILVPVEREGQQKQYVPYRTLKPGEQLSSEEIAKIQNYKEALDTQDLGVLRRPLTYLSDPEKMLGDIGIPGMETSEAERLYFAQRDNHPANIGMSTSDKMYDSFKYGLGKTPGAAFNVGLAMLGNPGASTGRVIAEALNPFPMPLPTRSAKINVSDDLARIAKQTDNVDDAYSLARQPLNPYTPPTTGYTTGRFMSNTEAEKFISKNPNVKIIESNEGYAPRFREVNESNKNRALDILENWAYENPSQITENKKIMEGASDLLKQKADQRNKYIKTSRAAKIQSINAELDVINGHINGLPQRQDDLFVKKRIQQYESNPNYINELEKNKVRYKDALQKYGDELYIDMTKPTQHLSDVELHNIHLKIKDEVNMLDNEINKVVNQTKKVNINQDFENKINNLYYIAEKNRPLEILDPYNKKSFRDKTHIVYPGYDDLSKFGKAEEEQILKEESTSLGWRGADNTITYGNRRQPYYSSIHDVNYEKAKFNITDPSTWFGNKINYAEPIVSPEIKTIQKKWFNDDIFPDSVMSTVAHEGGHDLQHFGNWGELLVRYDPKYKYYTTHTDNPLSKTFNKYMVSPEVSPWRSSANELHSDLMKARVNIINNLDPDPKKAVEIFRKNEDKFNEEILNSGKLDQFFKDGTAHDIKRQLLKVLPVAIPAAIGVTQLEQKQTGGEETSWTDYLNPANWGSTDRDDDGTFKQAFAAARKDGDDDFMWHGTRYSTELKKEASGLNANAIQKGINNQLLLRQAYKESKFDPKAVSPAGYKGLTQIGEDVINDYKKATGVTSVDPFKIQDAINVQKWTMNNLYNSDFINKPNQSEQVRLAKTLAAYNWGRGNVAEFLNNKKTAGHDIYNSLSWVKELPKETSDYINKILLGSDKSWEQELNKAVSNSSIVKLYKEEGGELNIDAKQISKDDNYLSLQDKISIYEKFINSEYKNHDDFKIAEKVFQKLNRLYYNEAKKENIHVLDYMKKQLGT